MRVHLNVRPNPPAILFRPHFCFVALTLAAVAAFLSLIAPRPAFADPGVWRVSQFASPDDVQRDTNELLTRLLHPIPSATDDSPGSLEQRLTHINRGALDIAITNPDGSPPKNTRVYLEDILTNWYSNNSAETQYELETDQRGHVAVAANAPGLQLWVRVPGVGYASTGWCPVVVGKVTRVDLPRLAPFGTVSGIVVPDAGKSAAPLVVGREPGSLFLWDYPPTPVGSDGRFTIAGMPAGRCDLGVYDRPAGRSNVTVVGGPPTQGTFRTTSVSGRWMTFDPERPAISYALGVSISEKPITLTGTVVDLAGNPLGGVDVYFGGLSNVGFSSFGVDASFKATTTLADGSFQFQTTGQYIAGGALVVAARPGYPLASCGAPWQAPGEKPGGGSPAPMRLVIPGDSGSLTVRITQGGKPAVGYSVDLDMPGLAMGGGYAVPQGEDVAEKRMVAALHPSAITGADGTVRFTNPTPGYYSVHVEISDAAVAGQTSWNKTVAMRSSLVVRPGEASDFSIAIPVGAPVDIESAQSAYYDEHLYDPPKTREIVVRVVDSAGKPAHACVTVGTDYALSAAGTTDDNGLIDFVGVPALDWQDLRVSAYIPGEPCVTQYPDGPPTVIPADPARRLPVFTLASVRLSASSPATVHVTLREVIPAYLAGTIVAPTVDRLQHYFVAVPHSMTEAGRDLGATLDANWTTGQYLFGPLYPGVDEIDLLRGYEGSYFENYDSPVVGATKVTLKSGELRRIDMAESEPEADYDQEEMSSLDLSHSKILMPDGKTPADGAVVVAWRRAGDEPYRVSITNVLGCPFPMVEPELDIDSMTGIDHSLVAAWLPGQCGPAVIDLPAAHIPATITLPASRSVHGMVTIGGKPVSNLTADIQVTATYLEPVAIPVVYTIRAPVSADGSFELTGILPGRYNVQVTTDDGYHNPLTDPVPLPAGGDVTLDISPQTKLPDY